MSLSDSTHDSNHDSDLSHCLSDIIWYDSFTHIWQGRKSKIIDGGWKSLQLEGPAKQKIPHSWCHRGYPGCLSHQHIIAPFMHPLEHL